MKKTLIATTVICIIVLLALFLQEKSKVITTLPDEQTETTIVSNYKNIEYLIDDEKVLLVDGISKVDVSDSSASTVIGYFGNELRKDLNSDGREDIVFILTKETGGSGTFFYAVAALDMPSGFVGSQAIYLGDRIAPQNITSGEGKIVIINYADRLPTDSFTTPPSIGKSLYLILDSETMQFGEVVQEFEGEADSSVMTLEMKTWEWLRAEFGNGEVLSPKIKDKFTLTFTNDGSFSATTDCNGMGGSYVVNNNEIKFGEIAMTMMYCEGSQEAEFSRLLSEASSYHFTNKGELILDLKSDRGTVLFR